MRAALRNAARAPELPLTESDVEGSHKNRILILEGELKRNADVRRVFAALAAEDPEGFARLVDEMEQRFDEEHSFFFRLDKQESYLGRSVLTRREDAITVRGKVATFQSKRSGQQQEDAMRILRAFLHEATTPRGESIGQ